MNECLLQKDFELLVAAKRIKLPPGLSLEPLSLKNTFKMFYRKKFLFTQANLAQMCDSHIQLNPTGTFENYVMTSLRNTKLIYKTMVGDKDIILPLANCFEVFLNSDGIKILSFNLTGTKQVLDIKINLSDEIFIIPATSWRAVYKKFIEFTAEKTKLRGKLSTSIDGDLSLL